MRCPRFCMRTTGATIFSPIVMIVIASGALHAFPAQAEEPLGRLFFTPERRQQLDSQREHKALPEQEIQSAPALTIDGVVTRSSGRRTVWVNGVAYSEKDVPGDFRITPRRGDAAQILVQPDRSSAASASDASSVRVGETVNRDTGETERLLGDGSILRHRRAPGR